MADVFKLVGLPSSNDTANEQSNTMQPVIMSFPSKWDPQSTTNKRQREDEDDVSIGFFSHVDGKNRHIAIAETERIRFEGKNEANRDQFLLFMVDKKTREAKLMNPHPAFQREYVMESCLKKPKLKDSIKSNKPLSYMEGRDKLLEAFGSGKSVKESNARKFGVIHDKVDATEEVEKMLETNTNNNSSGAEAPSSVQIEDVLMEARRIILPPFEVNADQAAEAYPLSGLIPRALNEAIGELIKSLEGSEKEMVASDAALLSFIFNTPMENIGGAATETNENPIIESKFICDRASHICSLLKKAKSVTNKDVQDNISLLVLAQALLWFKQWPKEFKSVEQCVSRFNLAPVANIVPIMTYMAETFAQIQGVGRGAPRVKSNQMTAKITLYFLVTCLHLCEFSLTSHQTDLLIADLRMDPAAFSRNMRELGCKRALLKDSEALWTIEVPLRFPASKRGKSKRS